MFSFALSILSHVYFTDKESVKKSITFAMDYIIGKDGFEQATLDEDRNLLLKQNPEGAEAQIVPQELSA